MIQAAKIIGTGLATTGLIGAGVGIHVVFGIFRNSSLRRLLSSYVALGLCKPTSLFVLKVTGVVLIIIFLVLTIGVFSFIFFVSIFLGIELEYVIDFIKCMLNIDSNNYFSDSSDDDNSDRDYDAGSENDESANNDQRNGGNEQDNNNQENEEDPNQNQTNGDFSSTISGESSDDMEVDSRIYEQDHRCTCDHDQVHCTISDTDGSCPVCNGSGEHAYCYTCMDADETE